jgi:hypothetical protein
MSNPRWNAKVNSNELTDADKRRITADGARPHPGPIMSAEEARERGLLKKKK